MKNGELETEAKKNVLGLLNHFLANLEKTSPSWTLEAIHLGLINSTWKLLANGQPRYILQQLNEKVFTDPHAIDQNIQLLVQHVLSHQWPCPFPKPAPFHDNLTLLHTQEGQYFRMFEYVEHSVGYRTAQSPTIAFEAARQFGIFTKVFADFDARHLQTTVTNFHNLRVKFDIFLDAMLTGVSDRIHMAKDIIEEVQQHAYICDIYDNMVKNRLLETRVIHHDAKIANSLFHDQEERGKVQLVVTGIYEEIYMFSQLLVFIYLCLSRFYGMALNEAYVVTDLGLCVVDLDTVMPGYFISDLGDLLRSILSEYDEEEVDYNKVAVRVEYFEAIIRGYMSQMGSILTFQEKGYIVYAGEFVIFMQTVRFLTDFLVGDRYYKILHGMHNYDRARNQMALLKSYVENKERFNEIVSVVLNER